MFSFISKILVKHKRVNVHVDICLHLQVVFVYYIQHGHSYCIYYNENDKYLPDNLHRRQAIFPPAPLDLHTSHWAGLSPVHKSKRTLRFASPGGNTKSPL